MSDVGEDDALLYLSRPYVYMDLDISGENGERPPDLGSKTQTPTGKQVEAPPLPPIRKRRDEVGTTSSEKKGKESDGGGGIGVGGELDHEMHIFTERERRKKMRTMFSSLHALLPLLPPKADKSTIVDEAVNYIKHCQQTLQKLQKLKLERLHSITPVMSHDQTLISPQTLSLDSREAFMADQVALNNSANGPSNTPKAMVFPRFIIPLSFQTFNSQNVILNISGDQAFINICAPKRKGIFATICLVVEKHNLEMVSCHVTSPLDKMTAMMQVQSKIVADELPEGFSVEEIYKQAAIEMMHVVSSYCYQI